MGENEQAMDPFTIILRRLFRYLYLKKYKSPFGGDKYEAVIGLEIHA